VLKRMKRPAVREKTLQRIARWREICPELTIRSTFFGFPGETVDHLDSCIMTAGKCFHDPAPDASSTSATEAAVAGGAGTEALRQIAPRCAGP